MGAGRSRSRLCRLRASVLFRTWLARRLQGVRFFLRLILPFPFCLFFCHVGLIMMMMLMLFRGVCV